MKYKITCRTYVCLNEYPQLCECLQEIEARFFEIENGFVGIWTDRNRNQDPDISVNVNDVLTIEQID